MLGRLISMLLCRAIELATPDMLDSSLSPTSSSGQKLSSEGIGELEEAIVNSGILRSRPIVGDVMVAVFGTNGPVSGSIDLNACSQIKGEIERSGIGQWDGMSGIHGSAVPYQKWLDFMAGNEVPLKAGRRHRFANRPSSPAGLDDSPGIRDRAVAGRKSLAVIEGRRKASGRL